MTGRQAADAWTRRMGGQRESRTMRRCEVEGCAMWCPGNREGCAAEAFLCPCGVLACALHGHVDAGDDPYCPHGQRAESPEETGGRGYEDIGLSGWEDGRV
jgi:hypothetical protein